jgi:3-hydroxyisobutyrate dehydrogenase-like beta-hydroxyacid dehydrogenase
VNAANVSLPINDEGVCMKVGFIGLGAMGSAMASNLLAAGHDVTVWNRSAAATEPLASLGAKVARTPDRAAQGDVLCSMLANDQAVREVFLDSGLLDAMDRGTVVVNHATSRSRWPGSWRRNMPSAGSSMSPHRYSDVRTWRRPRS